MELFREDWIREHMYRDPQNCYKRNEKDLYENPDEGWEQLRDEDGLKELFGNGDI